MLWWGITFGFICGVLVGYLVALRRDPVKARAELGAVEAALRLAFKVGGAWLWGAIKRTAAWVGRKIGL